MKRATLTFWMMVALLGVGVFIAYRTPHSKETTTARLNSNAPATPRIENSSSNLDKGSPTQLSAIPSRGERAKMRRADLRKLLESTGEVPEDADTREWALAGETS